MENKEFAWKTICKYADNEQDREDVFQDAFVSISRALKGFKGDSDIKTWIYRICVNTAINHLKKRKLVENISGALISVLPFFKTFHDGPEAVNELGELRFLKVLDPKQRAMLIMAEVDEMKISEISVILKIPQGTVKSTISRAKEKIRTYIRKENGNGIV